MTTSNETTDLTIYRDLRKALAPHLADTTMPNLNRILAMVIEDLGGNPNTIKQRATPHKVPRDRGNAINLPSYQHTRLKHMIRLMLVQAGQNGIATTPYTDLIDDPRTKLADIIKALQSLRRELGIKPFYFKKQTTKDAVQAIIEAEADA